MKTPAVTIVAAWISAETGVGPSIASGSQVWSGTCADLPMAPMNSSRQTTVIAWYSPPRKLMVASRTSPTAWKAPSKSRWPRIMKAREDAEREAEIADAVDDERLDRRGVGRRPVVPEADQQVGREADALPAEEHLEEVVGRHQHQHGEGEEREIGEEPRPVRIVGHVADRIDVDEARDRRHDDQHDRGQRIERAAPSGARDRRTKSSAAPRP